VSIFFVSNSPQDPNCVPTVEVAVEGVDICVVAGIEVVVTGSSDVGGCDVEAAALGAVVVAPSPRPKVALTPKSLVTPPRALPRPLVTPPKAPLTVPPAPPKRPVSPKSCLSLRSTHTILLESEPVISASPSLPSEPATTSPSIGFRRKKLILMLKVLKTSN
jgi:hypothetical protein